MRNTHYEVQIRKQKNGKYLVDLIHMVEKVTDQFSESTLVSHSIKQ